MQKLLIKNKNLWRYPRTKPIYEGPFFMLPILLSNGLPRLPPMPPLEDFIPNPSSSDALFIAVFSIITFSLVKILLKFDKQAKGTLFDAENFTEGTLSKPLIRLESLLDENRREWLFVPLKQYSGELFWTWIPTYFAINWQVTAVMGFLSSSFTDPSVAILVINLWVKVLSWIRCGAYGFGDLLVIYSFVEASQLFLSPFMKTFIVHWAHYYLIKYLGIKGYIECTYTLPEEGFRPPDANARFFYLAIKIIQIYEMPYEN